MLDGSRLKRCTFWNLRFSFGSCFRRKLGWRCRTQLLFEFPGFKFFYQIANYLPPEPSPESEPYN